MIQPFHSGFTQEKPKREDARGTGRMVRPTHLNTHTPTPGSYERATLLSKRDFAIIKVTDFQMRNYSGASRWVQSNRVHP